MLKGTSPVFPFPTIFLHGYVDAQDSNPWPDITHESFVEAPPSQILSFGEDEDGEISVADYLQGIIYRVVENKK